MTWKRLLADRRVAAEPTSRGEIVNLRALIRRNMADAAIAELSTDRRFDCAYSAARALATMVIRAEGYRVRQPGAHYTTFIALEVADRIVFAEFAGYFDISRTIRNDLSYDMAGVVSSSQVEEMLERVCFFESTVDEWLRVNHPELVT